MQLAMEFISVEELSTDATLLRTEKYVPNSVEMAKIQKFAEKQIDSGIVKLFKDNRTCLACDIAYDHRNGFEVTLPIIFNAEMVTTYSIEYFGDTPRYVFSLSIGEDETVKVLIQHAYFRHIMWQEELEYILDALDEAYELINEMLDDDDDDDLLKIHIY